MLYFVKCIYRGVIFTLDIETNNIFSAFSRRYKDDDDDEVKESLVLPYVYGILERMPVLTD